MESQIITDISVFNALGMNEFEVIHFHKDEGSLLIRAHSGSPNLFWSEITFRWTGYISCPISFFDVSLRMATEAEIAQIGSHKNASQLFCFEDTLALQSVARERFFIAANSLEITVYYGGEHLEAMLGQVTIKRS